MHRSVFFDQAVCAIDTAKFHGFVIPGIEADRADTYIGKNLKQDHQDLDLFFQINMTDLAHREKIQHRNKTAAKIDDLVGKNRF